MTHERWDAPHQKEEKGLMNKQVTFKFSIGGVLKILLILAILVGVFMLGRWSVGDASGSSSSSSSSSSLVGAQTSEERDAEPSFFSRLFGGSSEKSNSSLDASATADIVQRDVATGLSNSTVAEVENVTVAVAPVAEVVVVPNVTAEAAPAVPVEVEETVLTAYPAGTLAFGINSVQKEWYDTWGKMTRLEVGFKNNAEGTVKAKYLTMNVEGYDYDKRVPLVEEGSVSIKAGQTKNIYVVIPGGFAYNKLTAGDLKAVRIIAVLFDEKDVQIATENRDFNLEGPAAK